ncbi:hypothetical protein HHK36_016726 [Tetracentron sinense]|uniref:Uncharacterized protein n=1 Tax=Tetracentron sinense TaxID=13715 RepID=A0A835DB78_TETSI|nr:hypothetical protein HHK36_016726 [Tetracentron sinense]
MHHCCIPSPCMTLDVHENQIMACGYLHLGSAVQADEYCTAANILPSSLHKNLLPSGWTGLHHHKLNHVHHKTYKIGMSESMYDASDSVSVESQYSKHASCVQQVEFWICLVLTFFGYLPGIIYAVYAITK